MKGDEQMTHTLKETQRIRSQLADAQTEAKELRLWFRNSQAARDRLRTINADLLAALEPFAEAAAQFDDLDDNFPMDGFDLGECRKAAAAIATARGEA